MSDIHDKSAIVPIKDSPNCPFLAHNIKDERKKFSPVVVVIIAILMGLCFGIALDKARVSDPRVIIDQFTFSKNVMLQVFLSAVAVSLVWMSLFNLFGKPSHVCIPRAGDLTPPRGIFPSMLGGFILGGGMGVCGGCPGTIFSQVGAGVHSAWWSIGAGLVASYVYGLFEKPIMKFVKSGCPAWLKKFPTFDILAGLPYPAVAVPFAICYAAVVGTIVYLAPYKEELDDVDSEHGTFMDKKIWHPVICGAIIGSLQIPCMLFCHDTIGCSSSFSTLIANTVGRILPEGNLLNPPLYGRFMSGMGNWWQFLYVIFTIAGAFISSTASDSEGSIHHPRDVWQLILGGFMIIFGARIGGGCTSGHGISGNSFLSIRSLIVTAFMFGGGIFVVNLIPGFE